MSAGYSPPAWGSGGPCKGPAALLETALWGLTPHALWRPQNAPGMERAQLGRLVCPQPRAKSTREELQSCKEFPLRLACPAPVDGPVCAADSLLLLTLKALWGYKLVCGTGGWVGFGEDRGTGLFSGKPIAREQSLPLPAPNLTPSRRGAPGQALEPTFTMSSLMFLGSRFTRSISLK